MRKNLVHLIARQHHREPLGFGRPLYSLEPTDLLLEHLLIEK